MRKMKTTFNILLLALLFVGCNNESSEINTQDNDTKSSQTEELLKSFKKTAQNYTISANEPTEITGEEGTVLTFSADIFEYADGSGNVEGEIEIQLTEYYTMCDMLFNKLSTVTTDNKLLETAGMVYIEAFAQNKPLKLKQGTRYQIAFPLQGENKDPEMKLFNGVENEQGNIVWNNDPVDQKIDSLPFYGEPEDLAKDQFEEYDYLFNSTNLGWSNCDKYLAYGSENGIELKVKIDSSLYSYPQVILIYKNTNTLLFGSIKPEYFGFSPLIEGSEATIFAFNKIDGKIYQGQKEVVLSKDLEVNLELEETTLEGLKESAQALEWNKTSSRPKF